MTGTIIAVVCICICVGIAIAVTVTATKTKTKTTADKNNTEAFTPLSVAATAAAAATATTVPLAPSSIQSSTGPMLNDFPHTANHNRVSDNGYPDIWFDYPVFRAGSYKQLTNNLRYPDNPDNGTCVRADFCGALYHDTHHRPSNVVKPLPPAEEGDGARVGYFRTTPNELFFSIPTNDNILY